MPITDFIIELFCQLDDAMRDVPKHPQAHLYPSELVTLGILFALKGVGNRAFYRWLKREGGDLFPRLPDRTRLFRLFATHQRWTDRFLAEPTVLGIVDSYGIELIHRTRLGHSPHQIGKLGWSNHRWIVGGKLAVVLNQWGLIVDWDAATANVYDATFHPLIEKYADRMWVLADCGFHAKRGDPPNLKIDRHHTWPERGEIEVVFAMLTTVAHLKKVGHRVWKYFCARLAFTMAMFNVLVQGWGMTLDETNTLHLSLASCSL